MGLGAQHKPYKFSFIFSICVSLLAPFSDITTKLKFLLCYTTPSSLPASLVTVFTSFLMPNPSTDCNRKSTNITPLKPFKDNHTVSIHGCLKNPKFCLLTD